MKKIIIMSTIILLLVSYIYSRESNKIITTASNLRCRQDTDVKEKVIKKFPYLSKIISSKTKISKGKLKKYPWYYIENDKCWIYGKYVEKYDYILHKIKKKEKVLKKSIIIDNMRIDRLIKVWDYYLTDGFYVGKKSVSGSNSKYGCSVMILSKKDSLNYKIEKIHGSFGDAIVNSFSLYSYNNNEIVVLYNLNSGDSAWGSEVYLVKKEDDGIIFNHLGSIPVVTYGPSEFSEPVDISNNILITKYKNVYQFYFLNDVIYDHDGINEKEYKKWEIRFVYDGKMKIIYNF